MLNSIIIVCVDNNQTDTRHVYEDENLACAINAVVWICWYNLSFPVFTIIRVYCTNVTSLNIHLCAHWLIEWIERDCYRLQWHQEKYNDNVFRQVVFFFNIKIDTSINHVVFKVLLFKSKESSISALSFDICLQIKLGLTQFQSRDTVLEDEFFALELKLHSESYIVRWLFIFLIFS